jgi:hypothetical protein
MKITAFSRTLVVGVALAGSVGLGGALTASAATGTTGSSAGTVSLAGQGVSTRSYTIGETSAAVPGPRSVNTSSDLLSATNKGVPGKCTEVTISSSETTVTLGWKPPSSKNGGATVTGYRVSINGAGTNTTAVLKSSARAFTFRHLQPDTLYTASVRARNSKGQGPAVSLDVMTLVQVRAQAH